MRKLLFLFLGFLTVMTACDTRRFDACPPERMFGEWGVINNSHLFGSMDSSYYITNPIGPVFDSLYYNADYTDSYFSSDSTRITLQYTLNDTAKLFVDRLYLVEANPSELYLLINELDDTVKSHVKELKFTKDKNSDQLYYLKGTADLEELLMTGKPLNILATNFPKTYETNANAQNYSWILYAAGFEDALKLCYSLNDLPYPDKNKDTDKKKDKEEHINRY